MTEQTQDLLELIITEIAALESDIKEMPEHRFGRNSLTSGAIADLKSARSKLIWEATTKGGNYRITVNG